MTTNATTIGTRIGAAIADTSRQSDEWGPWDPTWVDGCDGDQLTAAGIEPGTAEWDAAIGAAGVEYERQRKTTIDPPPYTDGNSYKNPVICESWSEAFDCARERDRPVMVQVTEELCIGCGQDWRMEGPCECGGPPTLRTVDGKAFPSGRFEESL